MEKYGDDGIDKERGLWERRGRQDIGEEGLGGRIKRKGKIGGIYMLGGVKEKKSGRKRKLPL